jgi:hypothetical protein
MGFVCRSSKHGRYAIMRGEMGTNNPWDSYIITIEGSDAREKSIYYPLKKTFDQSFSLGK